ncbi:MAG TPA: hypothetical protein VGK96_28565 [Candidatus Sulfotelmatobacter sp.]|jgi:hypothetical protein
MPNAPDAFHPGTVPILFPGKSTPLAADDPMLQPAPPDYVVRPCRPGDFEYFLHLMDRHKFELGMLPREAIKKKVDDGNGFAAWWNGQPCGLLLTNGVKLHAKIQYTCIEAGARRKTHGMVLVGAYLRQLLAAGSECVTLRCREDLEANEFWAACGFSWECDLNTGNRSGLLLHLWRKEISEVGRLFSPQQRQAALAPDPFEPVWQPKIITITPRMPAGSGQILMWPEAALVAPASPVQEQP